MTPLVMVHGFLGGSAQWDGQTDALGRDVIAVDLPGFGTNANLPVLNTIGGFADWVVEHLRDMGVDRYHLLGHSMGGMIAQDIARRDKDRIDRLVLYATGAMGKLAGRFETIAESKVRATADGAQATARRIAATWFLDGEADPGFEACAKIAEQSGINAILAGLDAMQSWSGEASLPDLSPECLLIWGDRDRTYAWAQTHLLWRNIPHSNLAVIPGCAHAVHLEKPEIFNAHLRDFL